MMTKFIQTINIIVKKATVEVEYRILIDISHLPTS